MGENAQLQHSMITVQETEEEKPKEHTTVSNQSIAPRSKWLRIALYVLFVLSGQAVGTMLGRLYFDKGGKSQWMATLMQPVGFPVLILYYCFSPLKNSTATSPNTRKPPTMILVSVYMSLGLLVAAYCFLYSTGLRYLPVSTYSLICASQLAFNALFSYFLNPQNFTPFIVNSLILLTISSILLASHDASSTPRGVSRGQYVIGFICTVGASAGNGFVLSLTQLCFRKLIKRDTFAVVMDMIIYQSLVATSAILVGLFASGEWKGVKGEMEEYELGKISYVMNLVWISISWQGFAVGVTGLIFEVSSLFGNAVSALGLPVVPILAVIFFGDRMDCIKLGGIYIYIVLWYKLSLSLSFLPGWLAGCFWNFFVFDMGKPQELQLHIIVQEVKEENSPQYLNGKKLTSPEPRNYKWWISIIMYAFFVLFGQSASTLLGRLYYDKGGKSIWVATLAQLAGFPILIPCYCLSPPRSCTTNEQTKQPSALILAIIYFSFGICLAAYSLMYSFGLLYLPVSTFSLICASQLAFTALFSFFLHSQKFTPFIINSLVLLTISSTLLIFQTDPASHAEVSKGKYAIGFICTIGASAGYGLMLSLTQLAFKKLLKRETHAKVFEMVIYQSLIATSVAIVGLFISGEWKNLSVEMEEFRLGKFSYVMTLIETAIASEFFVVGAIGLIFEVSSLFSNAISVLGLPVIPILAVIFFHEKMDPIKVIAMVLAIWGFVSYVYQCYLDNTSSKSEYRSGSEVSKSPLLEEVS
ncbi:hypothetical protein QQP08_018593 [Theobroma cacao]|nr:hypothetical protein QQP08_018593 [Theobroma cacao]